MSGVDPNVAGLARRLGEVEAGLGSLARIVRRQPRSAALPSPPWNWTTLEGDELRRAWAELGAWVDWLVEAYDLVEWWPWHCWYRHDDVVHWLVALMWWHRAVHAPEYERAPGSEVTALDWPSARSYVEWHTAGLKPAVEQVRDALSKCGKEHHERSRITAQHLAKGRESARTPFAQFIESQAAASQGLSI